MLKLYIENASIFMCKIEIFNQNNLFMFSNCVPIVIVQYCLCLVCSNVNLCSNFIKTYMYIIIDSISSLYSTKARLIIINFEFLLLY